MSNPKMPDLGALLQQAQKLQGDVARAQEELPAGEDEHGGEDRRHQRAADRAVRPAHRVRTGSR